MLNYQEAPTGEAPTGYGKRNEDLDEERTRFIKGTSYRDLSTIMVVPSISLKRTVYPRHVSGFKGKLAQTLHNLSSKYGSRCPEIAGPGIPEAVVFSWLRLQTPANQIFLRISISNCEVGDAYNQAVQLILDDPDGLGRVKWMLTVETDNLPAPGALLQLLNDAEEGNYDAIGALYFQKGPGGGPMCFGKPDEIPKTYKPWVPPVNSIVPVNGIAMGFSLFKVEMFRHIPGPWFKTPQDWIPGMGEVAATQDLFFAKKANAAGYKMGVSSRVRVGHLDVGTGEIW